MTISVEKVKIIKDRLSKGDLKEDIAIDLEVSVRSVILEMLRRQKLKNKEIRNLM